MWVFNWGVFWAVLTAVLAAILSAASVIWLLSTAFPLTVSLSMADHNAIVGKLTSIESLVQEIAIHVEINHADQ